MSELDALINVTKKTGKRAEFHFENNEVFSMLTIGTMYSKELADERSVEVWLFTKKKLEDFNIPTFNMIVDNDTIGEADRDLYYEDTKFYDYHCEYFPKAWLEDIWPDFFKYDKNTEDSNENPESLENDKPSNGLMEFALNNGCDYMDMNTMSIYTHA